MVEQPKIVSDASPVEFGDLVEFADAAPAIDFAAEDKDEFDGDEMPGAPSADVAGKVVLNDLEIVDAASFDSCEVEPTTGQFGETESPQLTASKSYPPVPISPADLFGEFDVEEDVTVGNSIRSAEPIEIIEEERSIESVLHQEIIGLSAIAASGLELYNDPHAEPALGRASDNEFAAAPEPVTEAFIAEDLPAEDLPAEDFTAEDFIDEPIELEARQPKEFLEQMSRTDTVPYAASEPQICGLPDVTSGSLHIDEASDHQDNGFDNDDSDMLVIEDEVTLTRTDAVKRVDAREKTISVDFQAMLSRMRSRV